MKVEKSYSFNKSKKYKIETNLEGVANLLTIHRNAFFNRTLDLLDNYIDKDDFIKYIEKIKNMPKYKLDKLKENKGTLEEILVYSDYAVYSYKNSSFGFIYEDNIIDGFLDKAYMLLYHYIYKCNRQELLLALIYDFCYPRKFLDLNKINDMFYNFDALNKLISKVLIYSENINIKSFEIKITEE